MWTILNKLYLLQLHICFSLTYQHWSWCIDTICLPGTITKPKFLGSSVKQSSSLRYSLHEPRITFASLSVQRKIPMRTLPSVILIFKCPLRSDASFFFPWLSGESFSLWNYGNKVMLLLICPAVLYQEFVRCLPEEVFVAKIVAPFAIHLRFSL